MGVATNTPRTLGIVCYPLIGGSGILATELGHELADRGHAVHFFSYAPPVRLERDRPGIHFHGVEVGNYSLFRYPDYTLPLAVRLAEVTRAENLELIHAHYAVPHATAAFLARSMLDPEHQPRIVTTLHGTDTTLLGRDPIYQAAIEHALAQSDAVTTVSASLRAQTLETFNLREKPVEVIPNFFEASPPGRPVEAVRAKLEAEGKCVVLHMSNLRPVKRPDHLLRIVAASQRREQLRLVILAGGDFGPYRAQVEQLGLADVVRVVQNAGDVENYLQAADIALYTSEAESFGLSILESMFHRLPVLAYRVGGVPEVVADGETGRLHPFGAIDEMAASLDQLVDDRSLARRLGEAGYHRARTHFTAAKVVPQYEALYERVLEASSPK